MHAVINILDLCIPNLRTVTSPLAWQILQLVVYKIIVSFLSNLIICKSSAIHSVVCVAMPSLPTFLFPFFFFCVCVEMRISAYQSFITQPGPPLTASTAQASDQLFPNIPSMNVSSFSNIIPYGQAQDCDILRPICQTGSITVGMNLTTTITSTILPCSSYLSAQSTYLASGNEKLVLSNPARKRGANAPGWLESFDDYLFHFPDLMNWNTYFGQSPECRSYAKAVRRGRYTFSDCGSSNTVIQTDVGINLDYPPQLPPGVVLQFGDDYSDTCCGNCSLEIPEARVYYFPEKTATSCQTTRHLIPPRTHHLII